MIMRRWGLVPAGAYKNKRYSIDKVEVGIGE